MEPSIVRRSAAAIALLFVSWSFACSLACSPARAPGELGFAISTPTPGGPSLAEPRVVSRKVNLREPLLLGARDGEVSITFAVQGRRGAIVTLAPDSYEARLVTPFIYEEAATRNPPPYVSSERARVVLRRGAMACWTEEGTHRVLAQLFGSDGSKVGSELVISGSNMDVVGHPQIATADGEHVLIAFFVATDGLFQLVATWLDIP